MEANLKFNLNEEVDEFMRASMATKAFGLLWDIDSELRSEGKYGSDKTKGELIDYIRSMISESMLLELYN